jgi:hypothetical protein
MAHITADRVRETTVTTGTVSYALAGAVQGAQAFGAVCAPGDTVYYTATDNIAWEVGLGTFSAEGALERTRIIASSNAGERVNWSAGSKDVFLTAPSEQLSQAIESASVATAKALEAAASADAAQESANAIQGAVSGAETAALNARSYANLILMGF